MTWPSREDAANLVNRFACSASEFFEPWVKGHVGSGAGGLNAYLKGDLALHIHFGGGRWPCCGKAHHLCTTVQRATLDKETFAALKEWGGGHFGGVPSHDDEIESAVLVDVRKLAKCRERTLLGLCLSRLYGCNSSKTALASGWRADVTK